MIPLPGESLVVEKPKPAAREKTPRVKKKANPKLVAAARELRDRYLDEVNAGRHLIEPVAAKYDVGRMIEGGAMPEMKRIAA